MTTSQHKRLFVRTLPIVACLLALGLGCHPAAQKAPLDTRADILDLLAQRTKTTPREYMTFDFGRAQDPSGVSVVVPRDRAVELVMDIRKSVAPGWVVFAGTDRWLGDQDHPGMVEIVVAPGEDQFDILRFARSDAINFGMMTEDLISKLQSYDAEVGLDILQATTDTIVASMARSPNNMSAFASDVYDFCPDIVDQGVGSVQELRDELESSQTLYLWWD